jgi:hypothetical protein
VAPRIDRDDLRAEPSGCDLYGQAKRTGAAVSGLRVDSAAAIQTLRDGGRGAVICRVCKKEKNASDFYVRKENGRLRTECVSCHASRGRLWVGRNHTKRKAIAIKYYRANKHKAREWKRKNRDIAKRWDREHPDRMRAMKRRWAKNNPAKILAGVRRRQAIKILASPSWVDKKIIADIYRKAAEMGMEVDHIVPLRSAFVCGLHVPVNLAIVPREINRRKSNREWPGKIPC